MLFSSRVLRGVAAGEISVVFRRAQEPPVREGDSFRTSVGLVGVGEVSEVDPALITQADASRAGFRSARSVRAAVDRFGPGRTFRVEVRFEGASPLPRPAELDCADPEVLARFWAELTGGEVVFSSPGFSAVGCDGICVAAVRVQEHRRPDWPADEVPKQRHAGRPCCLSTQIPG